MKPEYLKLTGVRRFVLKVWYRGTVVRFAGIKKCATVAAGVIISVF